MHPILIEFSDTFFIGTYGLMIAIGLMSGAYLAAWRGRKYGFDTNTFFDMLMVAVISGFIGARLFYIGLNFGDFLQSPWTLLLSRTGFVFYGGLLAGAAGCSIYVKMKKLDFFLLGDFAVIAIATAHGFGRIGCHLAGCCFGGECALPVAIEVPRIETAQGYWPNAWFDQWQAGHIAESATHSHPIWPVQLMEAGALFILAGVLTWITFRSHRKGILLGIYLIAYSIIRFTLELLRGDLERGVFFGGASTSQIISLGMFAAGIAVIYYVRRLEIVTPDENAKDPEVKKERRKLRAAR